MKHVTRLVLTGLALMAVGCNAKPAGPYEPDPITPAEVQARRAKGETMLIADVRSKYAFEREHIEGAVMLPVAELSKEVKPGLPKDAWIVLYCT